MNLRVLGVIGGLLLLPGACVIPATKLPEVAPRLAAPANVRMQRAPNGVRFVAESTRVEVAGFALVIDAGALRDSPGKEGLAHWVEHLAFRSRKEGEASIEQRLRAASAQWNGFTSHDSVVYFAFAAPSELPMLIDVAHQLMSDPLANVPDAVFEHELRVVEAERGFRSGHAPGQALEAVYRGIYPPEHAYGRAVGGTDQSLRGLTPADARAFVAEHYRPSHMTLYVLAPNGDGFKPALDAVASLPSERDPRPRPSASSLVPPGRLSRERASLPAPELRLSWLLPARTRHERALAESFANVADIGALPKFESQPAIATGDCSLDKSQLTWRLECRAVLNDTRELDTTIDRLLVDLRREGSSHDAEWLWRVNRRESIEGTLETEDPARRGLGLALSAHDFDDPLEEQLTREAVDGVKVNEISELAFRLMSRDQTYLTLLEPLPEGALAPSVPTGFATDLSDDAPPVAGNALAGLAPRRLGETRAMRLSNGLTLLVHPRKTPYLTAFLAFRGGNTWVSEPNVARAAEEAETWSYFEPDPIMWGIDLRRDRTDDEHWYKARTVGGGVERVIQILASTKVAKVEWPSSDFRRMRAVLEQYDAAPENRAFRATQKLLYGDHPYAAYAAPEQLGNVREQDIRQVFSRLQVPERGALIVVGDVDPDGVQKAAEAELGAWNPPAPSQPVELPRVFLVAPPSTVNVEHRPASLQADLQLSCLLPLKDGRDWVKARLLSSLLSGSLLKRLRGATGVAYFVSGSVYPTSARAARFDTQTSIANRHLNTALPLFAGLLRRQSPTLSPALLEQSQRGLIQELALADTTTDRTARRLLFGWELGIAPAEQDQFPEVTRGVGVDELQKDLDGCLTRAVLSVVGDAPTLEKALSAAQVPRRRPTPPIIDR